MASNLINQIYKSRHTILEQHKSHYDVSPYKSNYTTYDIQSMISNNELDMLLQRKESEENDPHCKQVYIKYILGSLRSDGIYQTAEMIFKEQNILNPKTDHLILITSNEPNDTLKTIIQKLWETEGYFITIRYLAHLQFNILKHELVPLSHKILNESEIQHYCDKYYITDIKTQLPTISRFDPIAMTIGLRPGQVVYIVRKSPTTITSHYLRYCINRYK